MSSEMSIDAPWTVFVHIVKKEINSTDVSNEELIYVEELEPIFLQEEL